MKPPLSLIILTLNEADNLPRLLESIKPLNCSIFVVDSGSTDQTTQIAASAGAHVFQHTFESHALQWQWALDHLPLESDWILALDADQFLTPECAAELATLLASPSLLPNIDGLYIKRRQHFRGRWIRHGTYYPKFLLKAFRRSSVFFDPHDLVDHHFYVRGRTLELQHDLIEQNAKEDDLTFWIAKHNRYAALIAREEVARLQTGEISPYAPSLTGNADARILWLKRLWRRLPLFVRPFLYFSYRYFLRLGFLDGKQGFIFHFMQALWFRLLIDIKVDELRTSSPSSNHP